VFRQRLEFDPAARPLDLSAPYHDNVAKGLSMGLRTLCFSLQMFQFASFSGRSNDERQCMALHERSVCLQKLASKCSATKGNALTAPSIESLSAPAAVMNTRGFRCLLLLEGFGASALYFTVATLKQRPATECLGARRGAAGASTSFH